jgi:hypothetical protein
MVTGWEKDSLQERGLGKNEIFTMNVYVEESDLDGLTNETPGQYQPDWQPLRQDPGVCLPPFCH